MECLGREIAQVLFEIGEIVAGAAKGNVPGIASGGAAR